MSEHAQELQELQDILVQYVALRNKQEKNSIAYFLCDAFVESAKQDIAEKEQELQTEKK